MLKEVAAKYADRGVVLLGVMSEVKAEHAAAVLERHKLPWRNVIDLRSGRGGSPIVTAWGVPSFPSVFVVGRDGRLAASRIKVPTEIEAGIEAALAAK